MCMFSRAIAGPLGDKYRSGFRISGKGVQMYKGGFTLLILYHFFMGFFFKKGVGGSSNLPEPALDLPLKY